MKGGGARGNRQSRRKKAKLGGQADFANLIREGVRESGGRSEAKLHRLMDNEVLRTMLDVKEAEVWSESLTAPAHATVCMCVRLGVCVPQFRLPIFLISIAPHQKGSLRKNSVFATFVDALFHSLPL